jgi:hypothetical protein
VGPTTTVLAAQSVKEYFRDLVGTTIQRQRVQVQELTEFYLVNLLAQFLAAEKLYPENEEEALALMLKRALDAPREERVQTLRRMGDVSLYVSGFFSDSLVNKPVQVDYYVSMGRRAYEAVASLVGGAALGGVYDELATKFTRLVDVLNEISERTAVTTNMGLLKLYERWLRTGSERVAELLRSQGVVALAAAKGVQ